MEAEAEEDHQPGSPRGDEGEAGGGFLAYLPECVQERLELLQTVLYASCVVAFAWMLESRWRRCAAMLAALAVLLLMQHNNAWPLPSWLGLSGDDEDLSGEAGEEAEGDGASLEEGEDEQAEDCDEPDFGDDVLPLSQDDAHLADGSGGQDDLSWQAILATARQEGPGGQPGGPLSPDVVDSTAGEPAPDEATAQHADPMSKAKLDLLVRYMASVESRGQDQGTTPQRQKLQRKLLLRMCGGSSERGLQPAAPKAAVAAVAAAAVVAAAGSPPAEAEPQARGKQAAGIARGDGAEGAAPAAEASEALLSEDLSEERIEELLRELGESEAPTSAKAAGHRAKGAPKRAPKRRDRAAGRVGASSKAPSTAAASAESPELERLPSAAELGRQEAEDGAEEEEDEEEAVAEDSDRRGDLQADLEARLPGGGFEVVANRRARRKNRRGQAEPAGAAPAAAQQAAEARAAAGQADVEEQSGAEAQDEGPAPALQSAEAAEAAASGARRDTSPSEPRTPPAAPEEARQGDLQPASASASPSGGPAKDPVTPERRRWADDLDEEEDDWEWQCPSGFRLEPYTCSGGTSCSSCGKAQRPGAFAMRSSESGWIACEECVNLAWDQPVSSEAQALRGVDRNQDCTDGGGVGEALDPSRMSTLEIAEWFKQRGPDAEDALRQCMLQVAAADDDFD